MSICDGRDGSENLAQMNRYSSILQINQKLYPCGLQPIVSSFSEHFSSHYYSCHGSPARSRQCLLACSTVCVLSSTMTRFCFLCILFYNSQLTAEIACVLLINTTKLVLNGTWCKTNVYLAEKL